MQRSHHLVSKERKNNHFRLWLPQTDANLAFNLEMI